MTMAAGLRTTTKAVGQPPEPNVGAPVLDPTVDPDYVGAHKFVSTIRIVDTNLMETTTRKGKRPYQRHSIPFKHEVLEASFKSRVSVVRLALQYGSECESDLDLAQVISRGEIVRGQSCSAGCGGRYRYAEG
mgnify:CR=1 FL=1